MAYSWLLARCCLAVLLLLCSLNNSQAIKLPESCKKYEASYLGTLDRVCDDCKDLFREPQLYQNCRDECFTTEYFKDCVQSLTKTDELETFKKMIIYLNGGIPISKK